MNVGQFTEWPQWDGTMNEPFTKRLWDHNWNLTKILFALLLILIGWSSHICFEALTLQFADPKTTILPLSAQPPTPPPPHPTLRQSSHHFANEIFKFTFLNGNCFNLGRNSLKFLVYGSTDMKAAFVHTMPWHWTEGKALFEPMMVSFIDSELTRDGELYLSKIKSF